MTALAAATGPRGRRGLLGAAAVIGLIVAGAVVAILLAGSGSNGSPVGAATYGGIPKWLPKTKSRSERERLITATTARPALAIQGNTVSVRLPSGSVLATAVGPEVPEEGEFPVPSTSACTFVVTFADGSAPVPIAGRDFTVTDDEGHLHHPRLSAMDGGAPPRRVPAGRTVSLKVHGVFPTGDGALSWAPGSSRPEVSWDFDLEID